MEWLFSKCCRVVSTIVEGLNVVSRFGGGGVTSWHSIRVRTRCPRCVGDDASGRA